MTYTESDPLLPNGRHAPEIHGSQPPSLSDATDQEGRLGPMSTIEERQRRLGHILGLIWLILTLIFLLFLVKPEGLKKIWGDWPWPPQTIDERVKSILTNTPLIGWRRLIA